MDKFVELTTAESLHHICDIAADVWPKTFAEILSQEQIAYMMKMMYAPEVLTAELADGYHFELILVDDTPAGYISYSASKDDSDTAKLHKLYLLQKYHGTGRGQKMLDHAVAQCSKLGFKKVKLNVNKYNSKAINAYLRNGFIKTGAEKNDIGNGFFMDDFVMQKSCF